MPDKRHRLQPDHLTKAKKLRQTSTTPERLLWSRLRSGRLNGLKFRRQHPINPFIVDFYCAQANLVIELDGLTHDGRAEADQQRTDQLQARGLRVIRYTNDQVIEDVDAVAEDILRQALG